MEDSVASLDLVKWFVLNKTKPTVVTVGVGAEDAEGDGGGSGSKLTSKKTLLRGTI